MDAATLAVGTEGRGGGAITDPDGCAAVAVATNVSARASFTPGRCPSHRPPLMPLGRFDLIPTPPRFLPSFVQQEFSLLGVEQTLPISATCGYGTTPPTPKDDGFMRSG